MNIKTALSSASIHVNSVKSSDGKKEVSTERSHKDREGEGQQYSGQQEERRALTDEEMAKALESLKNIPGVKENHLSIEVQQSNGTQGFRTVLLKDAYGKVIRRYVEHELLFLLKKEVVEKPTGQLLNKAM